MRKTYIRTFSIVGLASILGACVTPAYVPPQSGTVADLAIRIKPAVGTGFTLYIYDDAESCSGAKTMIDGAGKVIISATKVVAEKMITFAYSEVIGNTSCNANFSFPPKADHIYVLDTVTGRSRCSARIVDATDLKQMVVVPIINRTVNGYMCAPLKKTDQTSK